MKYLPNIYIVNSLRKGMFKARISKSICYPRGNRMFQKFKYTLFFFFSFFFVLLSKTTKEKDAIDFMLILT